MAYRIKPSLDAFMAINNKCWPYIIVSKSFELWKRPFEYDIVL